MWEIGEKEEIHYATVTLFCCIYDVHAVAKKEEHTNNERKGTKNGSAAAKDSKSPHHTPESIFLSRDVLSAEGEGSFPTSATRTQYAKIYNSDTSS